MSFVKTENGASKGENCSQSCQWKKGGQKKYQAWYRASYKGRSKETAAARDAIGRIANSTWWEWKDGSRCLHWRWPKWYQDTIRDGLSVWFKESPKAWVRPQDPGKTGKEHEQMKAKLQWVDDDSLRVRWY
jgi:hypothetical protein